MRVVSPRHKVSGLTAGKICVSMYPAAATAGFFRLKLVQPNLGPHPYRRWSPAECFAGFENFFVKRFRKSKKSFDFGMLKEFDQYFAEVGEFLLNLAKIWRPNAVSHVELRFSFCPLCYPWVHRGGRYTILMCVLLDGECDF